MPAEYLVVVEWESLSDAQGGMPHVNVKPELLFIHGPKVLDNCLQLPSVRIANSMFREQTYREILRPLVATSGQVKVSAAVRWPDMGGRAFVSGSKIDISNKNEMKL